MPNVSKVSPATRIAPAPVIGEWTRGREDAGSSGLQSDEHRRLLLVPNGGVPRTSHYTLSKWRSHTLGLGCVELMLMVCFAVC